MKGRSIAVAIAIGFFQSTGVHPAHGQEDLGWLSGHADYAPNGVPDFSTCRPEWSLPALELGGPGQWTHAGPVALANALWWLDSRAETNTTPPPAVSDSHPLVTAYPYFGPKRDDHAPETVGPLVRDLATRSNTDGMLSRTTGRGTAWDDLVTGARDYVNSRGLEAEYSVDARRAPDLAWLQAQRADDAAIVLLLGAWEAGPDGWGRIGGHYAAVAGLSDGPELSLSDPLADRAAEAGTGRRWPDTPDAHSCRLAPLEHDDAAKVSHDTYGVEWGSSLPDDRAVLVGYFQPGRAAEVAAFAGQNSDPALEHLMAARSGGVPHMAVDAALAIIPRVGPGRAPTTPPEPTATPTEAPTASPTLPPLATARSTASPSPTRPSPWDQPIPTLSAKNHAIYFPRMTTY